MDKFILGLAPYVAGILATILAFLTAHESSRKSKHDELMELYKIVEAKNKDLEAENDDLREKLIECKKEQFK